MTRHLECQCSRCLDPTELGTHMSSIKCKHCPEGFAIFTNSKWLCEQCSQTMDPIQIQKLLTEVSEEMVKANGDIMGYEELLHKYAGDFHPNHFLMIDLKQNIATILRSILMNPMCKPSKEVLQRRLDLCEEILPVVKRVIPGYSKLYAIALYEYLLSFLELTELDFRCKEIPKDIYCVSKCFMYNKEILFLNLFILIQKKLQLAKEIALQTKELLSFEPANSPEGHLVRRISIQQEQIEESLLKVGNK